MRVQSCTVGEGDKGKMRPLANEGEVMKCVGVASSDQEWPTASYLLPHWSEITSSPFQSSPTWCNFECTFSIVYNTVDFSYRVCSTTIILVHTCILVPFCGLVATIFQFKYRIGFARSSVRMVI